MGDDNMLAMTLTHHADDATLMAYAAGAVTEGFALVIAAHLEKCPRCRDRVADAEDLGGELLSELPKEDLSADGLAKVWARIEQETPFDFTERERHPPAADLPAVLQTYFPDGFEAIPWRTIAPGIRQHQLKDINSGQGTVRLLSIAPGTTTPRHTHGGSELTLVLKGSFADEMGRFQAGDLADLDSSVHHQPIADTDKPCFCIIATDQRLKFSDVLSRMMQPLVGI